LDRILKFAKKKEQQTKMRKTRIIQKSRQKKIKSEKQTNARVRQWAHRADAPASDMDSLHPGKEPSPRLPQAMALDLAVELNIKTIADPDRGLQLPWDLLRNSSLLLYR